ncbi:MAG: hypothetical protein KAT17_09315 [Candidatus Aminicenantes bacterium]|nr:hypothetical protein [Candidatus Aminicenantes bacterium]
MKNENKVKGFFYLIGFLIPLLILSFLCNRFYYHNRFPVKPEIARDTKTLILGDSHAAFALDPDIIGKAVNFSSYGESYIHNYYKLKYALKHNSSIKVIILPIDIHSFSDFRKDRIHFTLNWYRFIDFIDLGWHKNQFVPYLLKYLNLSLFEFKGKYSRFFKDLFKKQGNQKSTPFRYGFTPQEGFFFQQQKEKARRRAYRQLRGYDYFCEELVFYFKKILNECEKNRIRVILLKLPITEAYFTVVSQLINVNHLYEQVFGLARQYKNIHSFDYQKLYFKNESGLFWDPQHLNQTGARNISTIIKNRLTELHLIE